MIRNVLACTALAVISLASTSLQAEEPYEAWLKFYEGDWKWTATNGMAGELSYKRVNEDVPALAVRFRMDNPAELQAIGVLGWRPESKALVDTGYNSNEGRGETKYTNITPVKKDGVHTAMEADGKVTISEFTVERIGNNKYVLDVTKVTADGEPDAPFKIEVTRK